MSKKREVLARRKWKYYNSNRKTQVIGIFLSHNFLVRDLVTLNNKLLISHSPRPLATGPIRNEKRWNLPTHSVLIIIMSSPSKEPSLQWIKIWSIVFPRFLKYTFILRLIIYYPRKSETLWLFALQLQARKNAWELSSIMKNSSEFTI